MYLLTKLWHTQQWQEFAERFKLKYSCADSEQQLKMLRSLLCEWRDDSALKAVMAECPEIAKVTFGDLT